MYCDDWVSCNDGFDVNMALQRTSELLLSISHQERRNFYQAWYNHIREHEYIALDITSASSYSKQIIGCEWGYNRDHEDLPQINICMLFGETSKLPVFQTIYSGSLKDVSTLDSTLAEFALLTKESGYRLVMDKKLLYKRWTFDRLLIVLAKLKVFNMSGNRILRPLTKEQKDIFEAFGVTLPSFH